MGKLGDLWVALGVDPKALKDGLKSAKKAISDYVKTAGEEATVLKKVMVGAAATAGAAIGAAFIKLAHDLIKNTQSIGDAWGRQMSGMKTAWQTFVSSVANTDFKNLGERLRNAFRGGKELYNVEDAREEIEYSLRLRKSAIAEEQALLEEQMKNQNLSYKERQEAAEKYLANLKPIYDAEEKMLKDNAEARMNVFLGNAGVDKTAQNRDRLRQWIQNGASDTTGIGALFTKAWNQSSELNGALVSSIEEWDYGKSAFKDENKRVNQLLNGLIAQGASGDVSEASKAMAEFMERALEGGLVDTEFDAETQAWMKMIGDPKPVAEQWAEEFQAEWDREMEEWRNGIQQDDVSAVPLPFDLAAVERMKDAVDELADSLKSGLVDALDELAYAIGGVEDANFTTVLTAFLAPLADAAVQAGMIIMTTGEGLEALKKALANAFGTGPGLAIAAGAALIGVGTAAKAGLAAIANRQNGAGAYGGGASADPTAYESGMEITVKVEGKLKGQDIVLSGEQTLAQLAR